NHIIHGDLKSGNVILTENPNGSLRAVITDFGLARSALNPGVTGGSPGYMAPELLAGAPTTVASDIYALGVLLYELVSGFRPHEQAAMVASTLTQGPLDTVAKTESLAASGQTQFTPLHSRWDPILKTCLQPDPKDRFQSADQVLQALGPSVTRRRLAIV